MSSETSQPTGIARVLLIGLLIVLGPILAPIALLAWIGRRITEARLRRQFQRSHGARGKFVLLVYSDSPHWKERIEKVVLPRIAQHAVVLNWSLRNKPEWNPRSVEVRAFRFWGGRKEFNPLAVLFPSDGRPQTIRFWKAYLEHKHGSTATLRSLESELFQNVDAIAKEWSAANAGRGDS